MIWELSYSRHGLESRSPTYRWQGDLLCAQLKPGRLGTPNAETSYDLAALLHLELRRSQVATNECGREQFNALVAHDGTLNLAGDHGFPGVDVPLDKSTLSDDHLPVDVQIPVHLPENPDDTRRAKLTLD